MQQPIITAYQQKSNKIQGEITKLDKQINRYALARLSVILLGGAAIFKIVQYENVWSTLLSIIAVLLIFIWLVAHQSSLTKTRETLLEDAAIIQNELDLLAGGNGLYSNGAHFVDDKHPYTSDLDVFGSSSLYHKINRAATPLGEHKLASWLTEASTITTINSRQQAVRELSADLNWCQNFQARLLFNLHQHQDYKRLLAAYLNKPVHELGGQFLKWYVKLCPFLIGLNIALAFFQSIFISITVFLIVFNALLSMAYSKKVTEFAGGVDKMGNVLQKFSQAFQLIEQRSWKSDLINATLLASQKEKPEKATLSNTIAELGNLINKLDYRLNLMIGSFLNGLFLWDFRQVHAITDWRKKHGDEIVLAFDDIAVLEALVSITTLHSNNEKWVWPKILAGTMQQVRAKGLTHPLIPIEVAVASDYHLVDHRIALITGSNMAGKSTFLRTVGVNMVLAFAGAPVCASEFKVSVMHLISYMRIRDSLNESTSTFKAELNRLEMILQIVSSDKQCFFLVDEMLRGTNSIDKYLGSKAIIERLIKDQGVGMVATHDLKLAQLEENYPHDIENFHFDIQIVNGEMLFDYKLKAGACTLFNASILLKKIGIDIDV